MKATIMIPHMRFRESEKPGNPANGVMLGNRVNRKELKGLG